MRDTYEGGYKKALLDVLNFMNSDIVKVCKSKKQYEHMLSSLLRLLLYNHDMFEIFMQYGGNCGYTYNVESKEIKTLV